jgi:hypothetical protein
LRRTRLSQPVRPQRSNQGSKEEINDETNHVNPRWQVSVTCC